MFTIDLLFVWILKYLVVTFLILSVSALLLRVVWQPVEKVSLIKITLASLIVALMVCSTGWLPKIELKLLPENEQFATKTVSTSTTDLRPSPAHTHNHYARVNSEIPAIENLTKASNKNLPPTDRRYVATNMPAVTDMATPPNAPTGFPTFNWAQLGKAFLVWTILVISCVQLGWVILGFLKTRQLLRKSKQLACHDQAHIRATLCRIAQKDISHIDIRCCEQIQIPIVLGVFQPCIILPTSVVGSKSSTGQLEHCLAHEWKHIDRNDLSAWGMTSILQPLLWMQPFFWTLRRELRISQDQIADQFAAEVTNQRVDYAETLIEFSKSFHVNMMGALSMSGSKSNVYRRVEMLLNAKFPLASVSRRSVVLGFLTLMTAGSLALASLQLVSAGLPSTPTPLSVQDDDKSAQTDEEKATDPVEYTGVVLDETTKEPVADAVVTVRRENSKTRKIIEETSHRTDANGKYSFSIPPEQQNERYLYIELDVAHETYCSKKGFGYAYSMIVKNLELGEPPFYSEVLLSPGEAIFGRIVDENGNPLSGVEVSGYSVPPSDGTTFNYGSFDKCVTDENGKFKMNYAKDGNSILWVQSDDHAPRQVMTGTDRGDLGDIQLEKGYTVSGKVVDALGKPAAGIWVQLNDLDAQAEIQMPVASSVRRYAKTDEEGRYTMKPMRAAKHELKISKSGPGVDENGKDFWETVQLPGVFATQRIEVKAQDQPQVFNVQGIPHVYVSGKFVNGKGEPTPGHMPHLFGRLDDDYMFFEGEKGDAKGDFFIMVPHGMQDVKLSFITNEHSALKIQIGDSELQNNTRDIDLGTLEEDFTDIIVHRYVAPILQVKVVDENGDELKEAKVGAIYDGEEVGQFNPINGQPTSVFFEKQKDGYHRSSQLSPDSKFECFAYLDGYERTVETLTMKEHETRKVTLTMKKSSESKDAAENVDEKMMKAKDKR